MTAAEAVAVGFGSVTIVVRTADAELRREVEATFRLMPGSGVPVATLDVARAGDVWVCTEVGADAGESRSSRRHALRWIRQRALERIVGATRELLWLHGAAAGFDGRALILPGRRGRGKSSLVTALRHHGATFLTDDMLPFDPVAWRVLPFPRTPEVRPDPGLEQPASWLLDVPKTSVDASDWLAPGPLPIGAMLLPLATRGAATVLEPVRASDTLVVLAEGCWNYDAHGPGAAALLARLVREVPAARLVFSDAADAAAHAAAWFASVRGPSTP